MDKKEFRRKVLAVRKGMDPDDRIRADEAIYQRLLGLDEIRDANCLLAYASYNFEADTMSFISKMLSLGRKIALPKVCGDDMDFYLVDRIEDLVEGYNGIAEPGPDCTKYIPEKSGDLILVPGSAFDLRLMRMGYGKGYYDRYLADHEGLASIGLAYDQQVFERIPSDEWDRKLDMIITDQRIIR